MRVAAAVLSALAISAAACYGPGERNQGAVGFPAVEYRPCCDGQAAVERAGDWGRFCPSAGGGGGDCYGAGERNQGAVGFPNVEYKPCCDGQAGVEKAADWGKFCPSASGGGGGGDCYGPGQRNQGAAGFPNVEYKPCCDGKAAVEKAADWGKFCPDSGDVGEEGGAVGCAADGERNQGAEGFPRVEYKPCCNGKDSQPLDGQWGLFCSQNSGRGEVGSETGSGDGGSETGNGGSETGNGGSETGNGGGETGKEGEFDSAEILGGRVFDTTWGDMTFNSDGMRATYTEDGGSVLFVSGLKGQVLSGIWSEPSSARRCDTPSEGGSFYWGRYNFVFDPAFSSFTGQWGYCESTNLTGSWTGTTPSDF